MTDKKNNKKIIIISVLVLFVVAMIISIFFYQLMLIQGDSMKPAYKNMSLVIVDKRYKNYKKGDVIAFTTDSIKGVLVKRIVGEPGDVLIITNGSLYVNGEKNTVIAKDSSIEYAGILENEICLSEGEYFVMGDNIAESKDSRYSEIGIMRDISVIGRICFPIR